MENNKEFEYRDVDYLGSPDGWLQAKLQNRFEEGYEIKRDEEKMAWVGKLNITKQNVY